MLFLIRTIHDVVFRSIRPHLTAALVTQQKRGSRYFPKAGFGTCENQKKPEPERELRFQWQRRLRTNARPNHTSTHPAPEDPVLKLRRLRLRTVGTSFSAALLQVQRLAGRTRLLCWTRDVSCPATSNGIVLEKVPWTLNQNIAGQKTR